MTKRETGVDAEVTQLANALVAIFRRTSACFVVIAGRKHVCRKIRIKTGAMLQHESMLLSISILLDGVFARNRFVPTAPGAPDSSFMQRVSSNQALERTADRREDLLLMTSTLKPEAQLALVSGRSAFSR